MPLHLRRHCAGPHAAVIPEDTQQMDWRRSSRMSYVEVEHFVRGRV